MEIARLYFVLGFTHIPPRGLDHVLFVVAMQPVSVLIALVGSSGPCSVRSDEAGTRRPLYSDLSVASPALN